MTTKKQYPYTLLQTILLIIGGLVIIAPLVFLEKPLNQFISGKTFNILLGTFGILFIWGVACFINWKKGNKVSYSFNVQHNSTLLLYSIFIIIAFQIGINPFIGSGICKLMNIHTQIDNPFQYTFFTLVSMILLGPILEELLFRGTILKGFLSHYSVPKAIGYSSILFGLIHVLPVAVVGALLIGLYLGWIYFKTRSIGITILLHITANLTGLVVGYSRYRLTDRLVWFNIYGKYSLLFITGCSILCIIFLLRVLKNTGKEKIAFSL